MTEIKNAGPRKGVLLVNLGTPAAPERGPVARFLCEFLSDPRVVDLPRLLWLPLLYGVIVPLRAGRSAAAYREIWMPEGSPLLVYTQRLAARLSELLTGEATVAVGMRYGEPSIRNELERMRTSGVQDLVIIPLYPQFSYTTTASIYDAVDRALADSGWAPRVHRVQQYFDHPRWVEAVADSIRAFREAHVGPGQTQRQEDGARDQGRQVSRHRHARVGDARDGGQRPGQERDHEHHRAVEDADLRPRAGPRVRR